MSILVQAFGAFQLDEGVEVGGPSSFAPVTVQQDERAPKRPIHDDDETDDASSGDIFDNPTTNPFLQGEDKTALTGYIIMQSCAEFIESVMSTKNMWSEEKLLAYLETMVFGLENKTIIETIPIVLSRFRKIAQTHFHLHRLYEVIVQAYYE